MPTIYISSDSHFDHANVLKFIDEKTGIRIRPEFDTIEEMNEEIIKRHNSVVSVNDTFYHLGDVGFNKNKLNNILPRLNGKKRLVLGNHDGSTKDWFEMYFKYFEKIMESRRMGDVLFTHRPAFLGETEERIKASVFGHIHEKNIDDPRYLNLSVEQINYTPISLDDIKEIYKNRGIEIDYKL